ncbi:mitoguardin 2-like [Hylobates moloch]|uniref:mitoguardin 2-like n=1 Tax=Hylobates moloch TaxID=81572 RepID=UPI001363DF0D|nr:mitoguardin 2-like [Hylobates moloch]
MMAVNSSSPTAACSGPWDARGMEESLTTSDGNAESLYMQGMELFEEALQKWEQALSVGQRGDSGSTPTPRDGLRNLETASEPLSEVGGLLHLPAPMGERCQHRRGAATPWEAGRLLSSGTADFPL